MSSTAVDRQCAEAAREAALAVPGVAALDCGRFGEVAVLLPGTRVEGLRPRARGGRAGVEVHVVVDYTSGRNVRDVADDVRRAVLSATGAQLVDVVVTDAR